MEQRIRGAEYECSAIFSMSTQYAHARNVAILQKRLHPDKSMVIGGHLSAQSAELVLRNNQCNVCVLGEGEETLVDLTANLDGWSQVKGIAYLDANGKFLVTEKREMINDLDLLGIPAYELFDIDQHVKRSCVLKKTFGIS